MLAHAGLAIVSGGFVGVDVFFVLSGYLITGLLLRELDQNGRITFMRFYSRRLKRLLPALIFMLTISCGIAIWLLSGVEARAQLASSPFVATWTSNLYFTFTTVDYFDELSSRDLFLHTWSLGVEEQFYLIWPALLLILYRVGKLGRGNNQNELRLILPGLVIAFFLSLVLSLHWTTSMPQAAFYLMPSRIWQLSLGAIIYFTFSGNSPAVNRLSQGCSKAFTYLMLGAGLTLIIGSSIVLNPNIAYPGLWALAPALGAALVIVAGHTLPKGQDSPLAHPVLVWLGDRSYSLYLWHWPIFILGFSMGLKGQIFPAIGMMTLSLLAATLSFRLIEFPFWKGRWSHAKPLRIISVSLLVMVTVVFATYHGLRLLPQPGATSDVSNQWRMDMPDIYRMPCDAWYAHSKVEPCLLGVESARKTVVFLGDSIGAQWFSMIPEIFPAPHWLTIILTKSSCAMVDEDYFYPRIGKIYQVCTDWRNEILDDMDSVKPDVLILGSATTYGYSETQWIEGSSRVLERLSKAAATVFVIPGTPSLGFDGPGCVSRHLSPEGIIAPEACLAKDRLKHVKLVEEYLDQAANRFPNVYVLKLNDLVCPDEVCNAINKEKLVVFRDSQHLTDSFVRAQIPLIQERMKQLYKDWELSGF